MARLLVVHHSPTRGIGQLTDAVLAGARDESIEGVEVVVRPALEATADDVLAADGYLLGTPANFGYMSGALKHFFDSTFLQVGGALSATGAADESAGSTSGRPFGLYVHGRYDTAGAVRSVLSIVGALGWRQSAEVLEVLGDVTDRGSGGGVRPGRDPGRPAEPALTSGQAPVGGSESRSAPKLATTTATGGITAATTLITTAAVVDQNRTTFQASTISTRQVPISTK